MDSEIDAKWRDLRPQTIEIAKKEIDNHFIEHLLMDVPEKLPEGMHACMYTYMSMQYEEAS